MKCCGNADCCPINVSCCNPSKQLPKILNLTFSDLYNYWPCADGKTISFHYLGTTNYSGYRVSTYYRSQVEPSPYNTALLCSGEGYYTLGDSNPACNQTPRRDCNTDVMLAGDISIYDPITDNSECKIQINVYPLVKARSYAFYPCVLLDCPNFYLGTTISLNGARQSFGCGVINYTFELSVKKCNEIISPTLCPATFVYYGATGTGTIMATVTE